MLPLCEELDSPLSPAETFPAFLNESYHVFLDSAMSPERLGRYSYITADPVATLRAKGSHFELRDRSGCRIGQGDPFRELQRHLSRKRPSPPDNLPPFQGGWVGYFGYELGRHIERLPATAIDDLGLPDLYVCLYDWVLAHDHRSGRSWLFADGGPTGDLEVARQRLAWVRARLGRLAPANVHRSTTLTPTLSQRERGTKALALSQREGELNAPALSMIGSAGLHTGFTRDEYLRAVERIKAYIAAGDTYEVNLSQRFDAPLPCKPWTLYTLLRKINPAPFAAYLEYPELTILSASPEQYLKLENGVVETRPIKGTRPRGATPQLDRELAQELVDSEKDRAENLMIVDLLRNDLGRVCRLGSVAVPEIFTVEEYPTVLHLVSTIVGQLPEGLDAVDLLRACFPGGSITGAPKIRAMEIIDEVEPTERGVYCGSIGYLGHNGCMNTSIVIRTMIACQGRVYFQAGGAIVADSDPEDEYEETLHKAKALIMALQEAERIR